MVTPGMVRRAALKLDKPAADYGPKLPTFAVAGLPSAAANSGRVVRCSNGNAGQPCLAFSDGTNWKVIAQGATVAAS